MMWYGRYNFLLSDKTQTLAAILLPHLVDETDAQGKFDSMDEQVTYLIGRQDKYTLARYRPSIARFLAWRLPAARSQARTWTNNLAAFQQAAWKDLPHPGSSPCRREPA